MGLGSVVEPVTFSTKSKSLMYRRLKADLEQRDITVPDSASEHADRLRSETVNLQYDYTQNGHLKVRHAPGGRDDYADSLVLANWARTNLETTANSGTGTWGGQWGMI
jgi:phage FluMu gp28-like protein